MEKLKSRKLWFFVASLLACIGLAYLGKFTWEVGAFLLALPASYGIANVADKRQQVAVMNALSGRAPMAMEDEEDEDEFTRS